MPFFNFKWSPQARNRAVAVVFTVFAGCMMAFPYFVTKKREGQNMLTQDEGLSATQIRRGAYLNSGSRDVGRDPDWDKQTHEWKGKRHS
mmetsp:Transcript_20486/g.26455  ORF Transcript_20486/g.26455 Transcript_20486/m.26455 type:complete len:89 (-) Transcript_20486:201-467(-)